MVFEHYFKKAFINIIWYFPMEPKNTKNKFDKEGEDF